MIEATDRFGFYLSLFLLASRGVQFCFCYLMVGTFLEILFLFYHKILEFRKRNYQEKTWLTIYSILYEA